MTRVTSPSPATTSALPTAARAGGRGPGPGPSPGGGGKLVVVALALALLAVVLVNLYIERVRRQVEQSSFSVYVLTRSVLPGDRLRRQDVREVAVPRSFQGSFRDLGAMDADGLENRLTENRPIERPASQGDILRYDHFTAPEGAGMDRDIERGKRLVSLPVNSRTVPGNLRPGMYVDIEAAFSRGGAVPEVLPVMERVKVKAVGTHTVTAEADQAPGRQRALGSYRSITIEVAPEQATQLSMIERLAVGDFELHLRNPADDTTPKIRPGGINPEVLDLIDQGRREPVAGRG